MGLLAGGSLKYTAPVPALSRYEPTGTWMCTADRGEVSFSNDGRNWQRADYVDGTFWNTGVNWVFGAGAMVLAAFDIIPATFKMTNTNPVEFTQSNPPPSDPEPDEVNDEWPFAVLLSHGFGGFSGTSAGIIRSSGDAIDWNEELPIPAGFADSGLGLQQWMPEVGLHIRLGAGEFVASPGAYWVSGNGKGWSQHLFAEHFSEPPNRDKIAGNGDDVVVVGLNHNGRIYRSVDGVNWALRYDPFPEELVISMVWNPQANNGAGAFFAVMGTFDINPNNLRTSPDGIFWNPVDPNDLTIIGELAVDPLKNLMICRSSNSSLEPEFQNGGNWMSDDDGETWKEFADRNGGFCVQIPLQIGPVVDETLFIDTGAIVISETRPDPNSVRAKLVLPGTGNTANRVNQSKIIGGNNQFLGLWAAFQDSLNPWYYEYRLDRISGDDFNDGFPTAIDTWVPGENGANWGYFLSSGIEELTFSGTLRIREKETLVESNAVSVSITASLVEGAVLTGVEAVTAVGSVGFVPHGEAALGGVEATPEVGSVTPHGGDLP